VCINDLDSRKPFTVQGQLLHNPFEESVDDVVIQRSVAFGAAAETFEMEPEADHLTLGDSPGVRHQSGKKHTGVFIHLFQARTRELKEDATHRLRL
jgi:hypothetical protein